MIKIGLLKVTVDEGIAPPLPDTFFGQKGRLSHQVEEEI